MPRRTMIGIMLLTTLLAGCGGGASAPAPDGDPDFTLAAQPSELNIAPARSGTTSIRITRPAQPGGVVNLKLEGPMAGGGADRIGGAFGPQQGGSSALTLTVGANVPAGTYPLTVHGTNGSVSKTTGVRVKVERWLLVDADRSANNGAPQDASRPLSALDATMRAALSGKAFDVFVVKSGSITTDVPAINGPDAARLNRYSGVVWYTGNQWDQPPTQDDLRSMTAYLAGADHKLVLQSAAFVQALDGTANVFQATDQDLDRNAAQKTFLRTQLGVQGYTFQYRRDAPGVLPGPGSVMGDLGALSLANPASVAAFKRLDDPKGQDLLTVGVGSGVQGAVAVSRTGLGSGGTSRAVYLGLSPDELAGGDVPGLLGRLLRN